VQGRAAGSVPWCARSVCSPALLKTLRTGVDEDGAEAQRRKGTTPNKVSNSAEKVSNSDSDFSGK
jgi:hypothetical protein